MAFARAMAVAIAGTIQAPEMFRAEAVSETRQTLVGDPVPLTEYYGRSLRNYTGLSWNEITAANKAPMVRVRNLQDDEFKSLVRVGYPFIVDDCAPAAEASLREMTCAEFGRRWPKEHMKAEYTANQAHIYLKDPKWHSVQNPTDKVPQHLSLGKPLSGPYIWHVKDETVDPKTKPAIMDMFHVPYFLRNSTLNANEARDSFEFWFVLENGGSQAHADSYCETTLSLQLRGTKTWRLGAFPNITNAFQPFQFFDGQIYRKDGFWQPEHEEVVQAGQCVVFPMGYIHETYVPEGSGGGDGCSIATTFQIQDPQPVFQWRNFLVRWGLSHYAREEPCLERMEDYVFLGGSPLRGTDEAALRRKCSEAFQALDIDGDSRVTLSELAVQFKSVKYRPPWTEVKDSKVLKEAAREKRVWMGEDALLFHDLDGDGAITADEFETSVLRFVAIERRVQIIKQTKSKKELLKKERKWIRSHLCSSDNCVYLDQLERDARAAGVKSARRTQNARSTGTSEPTAEL
eukprot:TRINITY_DN27436_c0_g1_i1.p1 TRINITY_DN27436_c0_g1~~TRINITY_DN27436_c0_g1_i1.p1  ORF type:complete len:516 (-),score=73.91 TRINITY_DN27436_c0_g1_i1:76-1623(-)